MRYLICTTPRSGSNYLCDCISRTNELGMRPFGHRRYERLKEPVESRFQDVNWERGEGAQLIERAFAASATANGVEGFNVMWTQLRPTLDAIVRQGAAGGASVADLERRLASNTRFVWLRRRDQQRQAISLTKAIQSAAWRSSVERKFPDRYVYDFPGIVWRIRQLRRQEAQWQAFFERCSSEPLIVYYEDYLANLKGTIREIADWLGISGEFFIQGEDEFRRQSGPVNEEWLQRYRRDASSVIRGASAFARAGVSKDWWADHLGRRLAGR